MLAWTPKSCERLVRYGVHMGMSFAVTAVSEGYFCGYVGIPKHDRELLNGAYPNIELDNEMPVITYDSEEPPVDGIYQNKNIGHWLGFDNNGILNETSVDVIKRYFPEFGDNVDYLAIIARKALNTLESEKFLDKEETEEVCKSLIRNIIKIREDKENE